MNLVLISGSARQGSITKRIALNLLNHFSTQENLNVQFLNMQEIDLPPVQQVWSSIEKVPAQYKSVAEIMFNADAFILVSPEYNGSYAPAMKNLLDHFPKQLRKTFGIVVGSFGAFGGLRAALQMQALVSALFGVFSPHMLVVPAMDKKFDEQGNLLDPAFQSNIDQFSREFLWLAERLTQSELVNA